jgi:hypothetical protein
LEGRKKIRILNVLFMFQQILKIFYLTDKQKILCSQILVGIYDVRLKRHVSFKRFVLPKRKKNCLIPINFFIFYHQDYLFCVA